MNKFYFFLIILIIIILAIILITYYSREILDLKIDPNCLGCKNNIITDNTISDYYFSD